MSAKPLEVHCPNCQEPVLWLPENPFRPFCSERCRQIDLGAWADETYHLIAEHDILPSLNSEDSY